MGFVANLVLFPTMKNFEIRFKNRESYRHEFGVLLFWGHSVYCCERWLNDVSDSVGYLSLHDVLQLMRQPDHLQLRFRGLPKGFSRRDVEIGPLETSSARRAGRGSADEGHRH